MAIKSLVPPKTHFATISLQVEFLHPVKQGVVTARARIVGQEGRVLQGQATVYDEAGRPVLAFSSTFKVARDSVIRGIEFAD
jgi:acyl-CoA thioesterase